MRRLAITFASIAIVSAMIASFVTYCIMNPNPSGGDDTSAGPLRSAETITSAEDFYDVIRQKRVVLYFDVDWASQAIQSRSVFARFMEAMKKDLSYRSVEFRRIDCTAQEGPVWDAVEQWLGEQHIDKTGSIMFGGCGAVVWVESGKVNDAVIFAAEEGLENLVARTSLAITPDVHKP